MSRPDGVRSFKTVGDNSEAAEFNGAFKATDGHEISCRALSFWFFLFEEGNAYRETFASQAAMSATPQLADNIFDKENYRTRANRYLFVPIASNNLGKVLYDICDGMEQGDKRRLTIGSGSHVMSLTVEYKSDAIWEIKFYDPHKTLCHVRHICGGHEELQKLQLSELIPASDRLASYFKYIKHMLIAQYDTVSPPAEPDPSRQIEYVTDDDDYEDLTRPGFLYYAMNIGSPASVAHALDAIIDGYPSDRMECLAANSDVGTPCLFIAMQEGRLEAMTLYVDRVLSAPTALFPTEDKVNLLSARRADGQTALTMAMQEGHHESVALYLKIILSSGALDANQKALLLGAKTPAGVPALSQAMKHNWPGMVTIYLSALRESGALPAAKKRSLITAAAGALSALSIAVEEEQRPAVNAYMLEVLRWSPDEISIERKVKFMRIIYQHSKDMLAECLTTNLKKVITTGTAEDIKNTIDAISVALKEFNDSDLLVDCLITTLKQTITAGVTEDIKIVIRNISAILKEFDDPDLNAKTREKLDDCTEVTTLATVDMLQFACDSGCNVLVPHILKAGLTAETISNEQLRELLSSDTVSTDIELKYYIRRSLM